MAMQLSTMLAEFVLLCRKHGNPEAEISDCARLIRRATQFQRYAVAECNGEWPYSKQHKTDDPDPGIVRSCKQAIETAARRVGAASVVLGGDPRGPVVRIAFADGYDNDRDGHVIVPVRS
jgi:hypothetical protein